jgi:hypothetical protein
MPNARKATNQRGEVVIVMRRSLQMLVGLALFGASCTEPDVSPCGEGGRYFDDGSAQFCAYLVVIGGFRCPEEFPMRRDMGETVVCARGTVDWNDLPADLTEFVSPAGADGGAMSIDGGPSAGGPECDPVAQLGCAAGEKCTWVAEVAGFPLGDTRCVPNGTVLEDDYCTTSAGGVPDDCTAGFLCSPWADTSVCLPICGLSGPDTFLCYHERTPPIFDDRPNAGVSLPLDCEGLGMSWYYCGYPIGTMLPDPMGRSCYSVERGPLMGLGACKRPHPGAGAEGTSCVEQRDCLSGHACIDGTCVLLCMTGTEKDPHNHALNWCPGGRPCGRLPSADAPFFDGPSSVWTCR